MPQNSKQVIANRRAIVAQLHLKNWTQERIAKEVGVDRSQISLDIKAIEKTWQTSTLIDTHQAKIRELGKLDLVETEFWDAWDKSTKPIKKKSTKLKGEVNAQMTDADKQKQKAKNLETWESTEERLADPRYLDGVLKCINTRKDILGLNAPTKIDALQRVRIVDDL